VIQKNQCTPPYEAGASAIPPITETNAKKDARTFISATIKLSSSKFSMYSENCICLLASLWALQAADK
jgi:hypothetical protein